MKKTIPIITIIILLLILIGSLIIIPLIQNDNNTIKICAIIPLTGSASQHAVFVDAIKLAIEEINSYGGINNKQLELIVANSRTDPEAGKNAFIEMESEHHPLLYISTTSIVSLALAPLAEENEVVLIGLAVSNPVFTTGKNWVFKYYVSPEQEAEPILEIIEQLGIKELFILYQDDPFGISHYEVMKDMFEQNGGVVLSEYFNAKNPDFESIFLKVKNSEAVYIAGFVNNVGKAIKQFQLEQYNGYILSHYGAISLIGTMENLNDIYVAAPIIYNPNYIFAREVKEKYEEKYNTSFTHQAANGYDIIKILAGLLEGQDITRNNVRELLENEFSFPGILGFIEKKQDSHDIHFPLYPARIENNEVRYLQ